jgi:hypothetical protein
MVCGWQVSEMKKGIPRFVPSLSRWLIVIASAASGGFVEHRGVGDVKRGEVR